MRKCVVLRARWPSCGGCEGAIGERRGLGEGKGRKRKGRGWFNVEGIIGFAGINIRHAKDDKSQIKSGNDESISKNHV